MTKILKPDSHEKMQLVFLSSCQVRGPAYTTVNIASEMLVNALHCAVQFNANLLAYCIKTRSRHCITPCTSAHLDYDSKIKLNT